MIIEIINKKNEILRLPDPKGYILQEWDGFAYPTHSLITERAPNQYGETIINKIFSSRDLNIQFIIKGENRQQVFNRRREILNILNPIEKGGVLKWIQLNNKNYEIDVELESLNMPGGKAQANSFQTVQISLRAPFPFWRKATPKNIDLIFDNNVDVFNDGDVETAPVYKIKGPVLNPIIKNLTSSTKIKINHYLKSSECITINTSFGNKNIIFEDENNNKYKALNLMDIDSVFSFLSKGRNTILFEGSETTSETNANISFHDLFIGV